MFHQTQVLQGVQQEQFFWFSHQLLREMQAASIKLSSSHNCQKKRKTQKAIVLFVCLDTQFLSFPSLPVPQSTSTDRNKQLQYSPFILKDSSTKPATPVRHSWHLIHQHKSRCKSERREHAKPNTTCCSSKESKLVLLLPWGTQR